MSWKHVIPKDFQAPDAMVRVLALLTPYGQLNRHCTSRVTVFSPKTYCNEIKC